MRVDSAIYEGYSIPPQYDSMLAKIIAYGETREDAINIMKRALNEVSIEGVSTNIYFEYQLLNAPAFKEGTFDTGFIETNLKNILGGEVNEA